MSPSHRHSRACTTAQGRDPRKGAVCLSEAIRDVLGEHDIHVDNAITYCLHMQLYGRWKHACAVIRQDDPAHQMPDKKEVRTPFGYRACKRLMPRELAREKMLTWIPWAIRQAQRDFANLADVLVQGGTAAADDVGQLPAEDVTENEDDVFGTDDA